MKKIFTLFYFIFGHFYCLVGQYTLVKGHVSSRDNPKGVSFVSVGIINTSIGTTCDEFGNFILPIATQYMQDSLFFSCIGYTTIKSKIISSMPMNISLIPKVYSLPEVVVFPFLSAVEILEKAKLKMGDNFYQDIYKQQGILTSTSFREGKCVGFTQKKLDIFNRGFDWSYIKLPEYYVSTTDLVNVKERRKSTYFYNKEIRGLNQEEISYDWLNIIKEDILHKGFLVKDNTKNAVQIIDTTTYNDEVVYVLRCEPSSSLLKKINNKPLAFFPIHAGLYQANFFINAKNYAIHKIIFSTKKYSSLYKGLKNINDFDAKWNFIEGLILYESYQNKYFPKYISYDESFQETMKNTNEAINIISKNQLVLTDLGEVSGNLESFKKEFGFEMDKKGKLKRIALKENKEYNEAFWQNIPLEIYLSKESKNNLELLGNKSIEKLFKETK